MPSSDPAVRHAGRAEAIVLASTIGSCWATSEMPVPSLQPLGDRGRGGQGDVRVERAAVLLGQHRAARPRRAPAGRDVGVLGDPQRLEAPVLELARPGGRAGSRGRSGRSGRRCASGRTVRRRRARPRTPARTREHPAERLPCGARRRDVLRFPAGRVRPARRMVDEPGGEWKRRVALCCASVVRESKRVRWRSTDPGAGQPLMPEANAPRARRTSCSVPPRKITPRSVRQVPEDLSTP